MKSSQNRWMRAFMEWHSEFLCHDYILLWAILGVLLGLSLLLFLSLPKKYAMTISLGLVSAPIFLLIKNKEKFLFGAFLYSLPLSIGYAIIERQESTNSAVKILLKFYISDFFLFLLIIISLSKIFFLKDKLIHSIFHTKFIVPLFLWIIMGVISFNQAIDKTAVTIGIIQMFRLILIFLVAFYYINGVMEVHFIIKCLIVSLLLQSILMFAQYSSGDILFKLPGMPSEILSDNITQEGLRPFGTMAHTSHFAKFSGVMLPITLAYIFFSPKFKHKIFALLMWVCGSIALLLTISRAGLATWFLSIGLFPVGLYFLKIIPIRKIIPLLFVSSLFIIIFTGILFEIGGKRIESRIQDDAGSLAARLPMWEVALNVVKDNPIFGVGLNNYTLIHKEYDHTYDKISSSLPDQPVHNLFLLYAAEIGMPGLLFFLWFVWELLKYSLKCSRSSFILLDKATYLGITIGVISLLLQSITGKGVTDHIIHLSVIGILTACVGKQYLIINEDLGKRYY